MTISKRVTFRRILLAATVFASPLILSAPTPVRAQVMADVSIQIAPPLLPIYVQPPMPDVGYIWTPGYWAYGQVGYYWVPGTWIQPPIVGVLWTPPYWDWIAGAYLFHAGYWGPHVGFYGGVNYGYGYGGGGYDGGRWDGDHFAYNRSANNFGTVRVQNVYERNVTVINRGNVSYAGGPSGIKAEPTAEQRAVANERHTPATAEQSRHVTAAASNPELAVSRNNGRPAIAATSRPAAFEGVGVTHAQPTTATGRAAEPAGAAHPAERAAGPAVVAHPAEHTAAPVAVAHPVEHAPAPSAAVAHPAPQAPEPAPAVRPAAHVAEPTAPHPAVTQAVARPAEPAAVHPAAVPSQAAAPRAAPPVAPRAAAPAREEKPEEKK